MVYFRGMMLVLLLMGDWGKAVAATVNFIVLFTIAPLLIWAFRAWRRQRHWPAEGVPQAPDRALSSWLIVWLILTLLMWVYVLAMLVQL